MVRRMKLPFLKKCTSSSSSVSSFSSSSSSWPWPSSHRKNPKTTSSKPGPAPSLDRFFSSSSFSSAMENPLEPESIENVIRGLKPSKRLLFDRRGESNSILEKDTTKTDEVEEEEEAHKEEDEEGFMLLSLESNDPYNDFKKSMEKMVEVHELHHDWRSLEKLLFWFLKVNVKTSHKYIFTAFVDLLLNLPLDHSKDIIEESPSLSSSPISFNTSCSSSNETSSTSVRFLPGNSSISEIKSVDCCLSSLFEMEEKINDNLDYVSS